MHARHGSDRRVSRTRTTLLSSFDRLLLTGGYDAISVRALAAAADLGRSTVYEHFAGKDDLLEESVARRLAVLSACVTEHAPSDALRALLTHVRAYRPIVRALLHDAGRAIVIRALSRTLEEQLGILAERLAARPIAPLGLLAAALAQAQIGAADAWLADDPYCDVATAARVLHAMSQTTAAAFFETNAKSTVPYR